LNASTSIIIRFVACLVAAKDYSYTREGAEEIALYRAKSRARRNAQVQRLWREIDGLKKDAKDNKEGHKCRRKRVS
jgi:hypothetical protein